MVPEEDSRTVIFLAENRHFLELSRDDTLIDTPKDYYRHGSSPNSSGSLILQRRYAMLLVEQVAAGTRIKVGWAVL